MRLIVVVLSANYQPLAVKNSLIREIRTWCLLRQLATRRNSCVRGVRSHLPMTQR